MNLKSSFLFINVTERNILLQSLMNAAINMNRMIHVFHHKRKTCIWSRPKS